jgi:cyclo(L-tyrosyl-L-tyrosyl) synthase
MINTKARSQPLQTLVTTHALTHNCETLYERGEHAILGISPFNSYFSVATIATLSSWAVRHFKSFHLFIPDETSVYTLMALGYDQATAVKKARRQGKYLRNKCLRALGSLNRLGDEAEVLILDCQYLNQNPSYLATLAFYEKKYARDGEFRASCLEASKQVIEAHDRPVNSSVLAVAVKYVLAELPLFFNSVPIVGKKEVVFCYHDCLPLVQATFESKNLVSSDQGYLVVSMDSYSREAQLL